MASKEEICSRVAFEASKVYASYDNRHPSIPDQEAMAVAVRPLVERVIELEEEGAKHTALTVKLAQAEQRVIEQGRTVEVLNADRSRLSADLVETQAELRTKERELDEERAAKHDVLRGRTMAENTIVELRASLRTAHAELRTATREHDETTAALRAQVAALQGVIDGHEQAIRDACADVRAEYEDERATDRARRTRLVDTIAALETTVDVLAGRLAARGA